MHMGIQYRVCARNGGLDSRLRGNDGGIFFPGKCPNRWVCPGIRIFMAIDRASDRKSVKRRSLSIQNLKLKTPPPKRYADIHASRPRRYPDPLQWPWRSHHLGTRCGARTEAATAPRPPLRSPRPLQQRHRHRNAHRPILRSRSRPRPKALLAVLALGQDGEQVALAVQRCGAVSRRRSVFCPNHRQATRLSHCHLR